MSKMWAAVCPWTGKGVFRSFATTAGINSYKNLKKKPFLKLLYHKKMETQTKQPGDL